MDNELVRFYQQISSGWSLVEPESSFVVSSQADKIIQAINALNETYIRIVTRCGKTTVESIKEVL